ncbi:MAG: hypothetical protein AAF950_15100 [Pseudomonadota bacterium]
MTEPEGFSKDRDAIAALDRFFDELRTEVRSNPDLAYRLVKALGADISFESTEAAKLLNLRELAGTKSEEKFRTSLETLSLAQIKSVMKTNNLASPVDMKGMKKPELVDMAHERAIAKAKEKTGK